ncbi:hypothetical protein VBJ73_22720 [Enterobacter hormaechei]|jgi:hypothetical protein|uniref:Uncharacterized protein n=2 Tax=Enterobacter cloacae complex TaxID=354276 RepID=A0A6G4LMQ5_9ENTR|nr:MULTISPECIES: hypothetical protein [Gammaproteobacteria]AYI50227.1 hypothetical protein [Enterobacter cloacae]EGP1987848.1 hypothetical protein [Salmonella enterica subsp. enterica serovar Kentucky]EIH0499927.1 hypothetical protein [Salmonella enterica]EKO3774187.1 hypothetical protein [Vibrio metschnikovii]HBM7666713.1 hypothetical protein [Enterobacter cloacae subsp. cloacae]
MYALEPLERDVIGSFDKFAVQLSEEKPDQDIFEFDLTLWTLLKLLSANAPSQVSNHFSLPEDLVNKLASTPDSYLSQLASGVLLSFKLETDQMEVIDTLAGSYDSVICLKNVVDDFDAAYWLLLNKLASRNLDMAMQSFGVSSGLASSVAASSNSQLRSLSHRVVIRFSLRFDIGVLDQFLSAALADTTPILLKKIQQSLVWR